MTSFRQAALESAAVLLVGFAIVGSLMYAFTANSLAFGA